MYKLYNNKVNNFVTIFDGAQTKIITFYTGGGQIYFGTDLLKIYFIFEDLHS